MSSANVRKTILLSATMACIAREELATVAVVPGMLLARTAGGVAPHAAAAGIANLHFAVEDGAQGRTIDDSYAIDDTVHFATVPAGAGVNALVAAAAAAIVKGDKLVSNGDGTLKKLVAAAGGTVIAEALEAVDNSVGATRARIAVEVMPAAYVAPV